MTDWSNWRPLNIQSSERSEALLATKTVFKTLQHNPPREAYGMSKAQIVGWAHAPFGKSEAPDTEALMASVVAPALTHAGVAPNEVDGIFVGVMNNGFSKQDFQASLVGMTDEALAHTPAMR